MVKPSAPDDNSSPLELGMLEDLKSAERQACPRGHPGQVPGLPRGSARRNGGSDGLVNHPNYQAPNTEGARGPEGRGTTAGKSLAAH